MADINSRTIIDLNLNWKFMLDNTPNNNAQYAEAWQKGYDDSKWRDISLPHDWAVEQPFDISCSSGTGYLPGGVAFYRKKFLLSNDFEGMRVIITFDGIYNNSMIWCNGYYLGKRPSGYSEIIYDITEFVCFGENPNVITVKVAHNHIADSRWYTGSGIYRKVTLTVTDKVYIDNHGVHITTSQADEKRAVVLSRTFIHNTTALEQNIAISQTLTDARGILSLKTELSRIIMPDNTLVCEQELFVDNPKLWSTQTPHMYLCLTEIKREGEVIDSVTNYIGIRSFEFTADKGFFLNGESMKLKGVCVHHDAGCLGAAVREKVWRRRLTTLKEIGCNAIRMSHNPHMPELYDLCDEMGFLVIDEAFDEWEGVKNKWSTGHNVYPPKHFGYYEDFPAWHEEDLSAMVLRDRNHPSVILWSIGNEIDYPNDPYVHPSFDITIGNNDANKPKAERVYDPTKPNAKRLVSIAARLAAIVKKHDISRPVTAALAFPEMSNLIGLADCLDVVGYNYKEFLYIEDHQKYPQNIIIGSENGKNFAEWLAVKENEYIAGQFLWTGIDYLGETSGWPSHGSGAGLLDIAGFKKPAAYFRKSLWTKEPMVKLFAEIRRNEEENIYSGELVLAWEFARDELIRIYCFSNCVELELLLNGKNIGKKSMADCRNGYATFEIPFEKGEIKAIGTHVSGTKVFDLLKSVGVPAEIKLECLNKEINADGQDITHIIASIVDYEGNLVPMAQNVLNVSIEGPGKILGLENGNLRDTTPYAEAYRRANNGTLLIYIASTCEKGIITLSVHGEMLKNGKISISAI